MNKLVVATLALSLLLLTGGVALAQTARARIADTPIRGEANLASAIITTLSEGAAVDVVDVQGDWYRVLVPNDRGTPRVGYVLVHLIDIVNSDGSLQPAAVSPTRSEERPVVQGPFIPPSLVPRPLQRDKAAEREQALKAEVDALQADLAALQTEQPGSQVLPDRVRAVLHPRDGDRFWFNAGLGFGFLSCDGCAGSFTGASGGLSVGTTLNESVRLGIGTTGWVDGSGVSAGTLDARIRYYPVHASGFFVTGGLGVGHISIPAETEYGVGVVLGVGWDVRLGRNVSLTPFWNGFGVATSRDTVSVGQLGVGVTVHLPARSRAGVK